MKKLIMIFLLISSPAWPATHTVNQDGSGADYSIAEFNALTGTGFAGDTFTFSGTITTPVTVQIAGTSGNYVTLDGYQADDTTYVVSEATGRALIDVGFGNDGIQITTNSNIIIQDFEIANCSKGIDINDPTNSGDNIIIRRNFIHECDRNAIYIGIGSSGVVVGPLGQGNVAKNIGIDATGADIATCTATDFIISGNYLYSNSSSYGVCGVVVTCPISYNWLIEYNNIENHNFVPATFGQNGIALKKGAYNGIIRFNEIHGLINTNSGSAVILNTSEFGDNDTIYIYGNYFHDNRGPGVDTQYSEGMTCNDNYVFSNIIVGSVSRGLTFMCHGNITVFNNIIAESDSGTGSTDAGLYSDIWFSPVSLTLKNNIFYKNVPTESTYRQYSISNNTDEVVIADNNLFYWPGQQSIMYWGDDGNNTLAGLQAMGSPWGPQETNGTEGDPGLVDIANRDYRINSTGSAAYGTGTDMGSGAIATITIQGVEYPVYWDVALGPNTDWSGTIPVIDERRRDDYQWDIGPYLYSNPLPITGVTFGSGL